MILFHVSKERGIFVNYIELSVFIAYFVFMVAIGLYFFSKSKGAGEKDYFLGGRNMGAWVSALSAGASDMSAWVLMGLPASIYLSGMGQTWIAIGLGIGYAVSWIFMAPRLRRFSIAANDSITIPQYLTNRFLSKNKSLQILSAIIFLVAYTIYAASSIKACGTCSTRSWTSIPPSPCISPPSSSWPTPSLAASARCAGRISSRA